MRIRTLVWWAIILAVNAALPFAPAYAIDLNGAWAADQAMCQNLFVKKGKAIAFRPQAALSGGGFLIDGDVMRGKLMKCTIKARHEDGQTIHLRAACASDLMLSDVQFSAKIVDENRITRYFPGMDGVEHTYYRCAL